MKPAAASNGSATALLLLMYRRTYPRVVICVMLFFQFSYLLPHLGIKMSTIDRRCRLLLRSCDMLCAVYTERPLPVRAQAPSATMIPMYRLRRNTRIDRGK